MIYVIFIITEYGWIMNIEVGLLVNIIWYYFTIFLLKQAVFSKNEYINIFFHKNTWYFIYKLIIYFSFLLLSTFIMWPFNIFYHCFQLVVTFWWIKRVIYYTLNVVNYNEPVVLFILYFSHGIWNQVNKPTPWHYNMFNLSRDIQGTKILPCFYIFCRRLLQGLCQHNVVE